MKKTSSPRRIAREYAMKGIYQWLINPDRTPHLIERHLFEEQKPLSGSALELFSSLLFGSIKESSHLEQLIAPFCDRPVCELSPIERSIVLAGSFEILHHKETPCPVIINEFIEIAKVFGGTDGHKFVNGVLDKLAIQERGQELEAWKKNKMGPK
jgi:N utilization substance protein B